MLFIEKTDKSVQEVVDSFQELAPKHKFGVQHIHNVTQNIKSKGLEFENECQIIDICNPVIAKSFLEADMQVSALMPCKISVYEKLGETHIVMNSLSEAIKSINGNLTSKAKEAQDKLLELIKEVK